MQRCYYLKRKLGKNLLLHPYLEKGKAAEWDPDEPLSLLFSCQPEHDEAEEYRLELYSSIDRGVDSWIQELKYIPRLILSALAFLVIYFFFSFVIRDPLPFVDELIAGAAGAALVYIMIASRQKKSGIALKKRMEMKHAVDSASSGVMSELEKLEALLQDFDEMGTISLAEKVCGLEGGLPAIEDALFDDELRRWLRLYLGREERHRKILARIPSVDRRNEQLKYSAFLLHAAMRRRIDLPLIALYFTLQPSDR